MKLPVMLFHPNPAFLRARHNSSAIFHHHYRRIHTRYTYGTHYNPRGLNEPINKIITRFKPEKIKKSCIKPRNNEEKNKKSSNNQRQSKEKTKKSCIKPRKNSRNQFFLLDLDLVMSQIHVSCFPMGLGLSLDWIV